MNNVELDNWRIQIPGVAMKSCLPRLRNDHVVGQARLSIEPTGEYARPQLRVIVGDRIVDDHGTSIALPNAPVDPASAEGTVSHNEVLHDVGIGVIRNRYTTASLGATDYISADYV